MLETDPSFRPVRVREGYPPLEDLGLIGDGATVALVGPDGSIYWLCLPRFDSEPVFCGLLDRERGGHFTITPEELTEARQPYWPGPAHRCPGAAATPWTWCCPGAVFIAIIASTPRPCCRAPPRRGAGG